MVSRLRDGDFVKVELVVALVISDGRQISDLVQILKFSIFVYNSLLGLLCLRKGTHDARGRNLPFSC